MTDILHQGAGVVFMKVGTHADEPLPNIFARKRREIDEAGYALWGYGGGTCHPLTAVQPFARNFVRDDGTIYLVMHPMESHHYAVSERASEFSADGAEWEEVPGSINVIGSRFAMKIDTLEENDFELPLAGTRVAVGPQIGRRGDRYVRGRVDKACLEVTEEPVEPDEAPPMHIQLVARLVEPYAVLLRS